MPRALTPDERRRVIALKQEYDWRLWRLDEDSFLREAWYIKHPNPEIGKMKFDLRPAQVKGLQHWRQHRYSLTLKARQIGWSTLVSAHAFWFAYFKPDVEVILISRTEREAVDLLRKAKFGYQHLPEWIKDRGPESLTDHQQKMVFANGSSIVSMPSATDPARGSSASLIVVDEWAALPDGEGAWASIAPVADVGGRVIGLSTAKGVGNFFHDLWVGAETDTNPFKTMFMSWAAGGRDQAWYEEQKRLMNDWQLAQEYPTTAEEAFIRSGRPIFDLDAIARQEIILPRRGYLHELGT
jgi:hypothetical protein